MGWRLEWITIPENIIQAASTMVASKIMMRMMTPESVLDHTSLDFLIISVPNFSIWEKKNHDVLGTTYTGLDQAM
jgi:hypothetical protein